MLFYEDLVRKIEEEKIENIKKSEKFGLNGMKSLVGYGIAIPLILIGLFEVYSYTIYHKWYLLLIGVIFLGIGLKQFKNVLTYSYIIDSDAKTFHINHLIDVSNNSYLASLSKPLTFIEAEKLLYS